MAWFRLKLHKSPLVGVAPVGMIAYYRIVDVTLEGH